MTRLARKQLGSLVQFIKDGGDNLEVPKPFEQPIFLLDTRIAKTQYVEGIDKRVHDLFVGTRLRFQRDVDNRFDKMAIRVLDSGGYRLGYVPADCNEILARMMDGGKLLFGEVTELELLGEHKRISMKVFLDD